jgi:hypothetical protein
MTCTRLAKPWQPVRCFCDLAGAAQCTALNILNSPRLMLTLRVSLGCTKRGVAPNPRLGCCFAVSRPYGLEQMRRYVCSSS